MKYTYVVMDSWGRPVFVSASPSLCAEYIAKKAIAQAEDAALMNPTLWRIERVEVE